MLNTFVKMGAISHESNVNMYDSSSIFHTHEDSFFIAFEWGSEFANNLMGTVPRYRYHDVEIIQMRTMLDRIVAELVIKEENE